MTKEEKSVVIKDLTAQLAANHVIYLADLTGLDAKTTSDLRRACFKAGIKLSVVKNTLLAKAMEASDKNFGDLPSTLKGNTSLMFAEVRNAPAKLIQNFRKKSDKPILKGAGNTLSRPFSLRRFCLARAEPSTTGLTISK